MFARLPFPSSLLPFIITCIRTKKFDDVIVMERSRKSVRRFIKLYLGINDTPYRFHQTLTFKDNLIVSAKAKQKLNKLLDLLRKEFPQMPVLYVEERQKRLGVHYHVIFMFFGSQPLTPEETRQRLLKAIFPRWKAINGGTLHQMGNQLKLSLKPWGLWYLLEGVKLSQGKSRREHWYGVRQDALIRANSHKVSAQDVSRAMRENFGSSKLRKPPIAPPRRVYTSQDISGMKSYLDWTGSAVDMDDVKRRDTGRKGKVSDEDYLRFLNGKSGRKSKPDKDVL